MTKISFLISSIVLLLSPTLFSQQIKFLNSEDSLPIRVNVHIHNEEKKIAELKSINGVVDFSNVQIGANVEVFATGFQDKFFPMVENLPPIIYLYRRAKKIDEMVVTGQMQQTSISDAVQNVRIINSKKIEQMGAQNLTQLFKNELNIQLSTDQILGSGMSLQGISGENVKILIDGVPIIGRLNGTIDLDQINIQNVEKIEIIEGPLSVNYGSDALAGTINIITKKNQTASLSGKAYTYYESNGTYNAQINLSSHIKHTTISGDINRNYFDGWRTDENPFHFEKKRLADDKRTKLYKPREQIFGGLKIRQKLNPKNREEDLFLTADFRIFQEEIENRGTPLKPYYIKAFDDFYRTYRYDNSIAITGKISNKWSINSTNAYNYFERKKSTYINDLTTLNKTIAGPNEQDTSIFDLILSRTSFIYSHSKKIMLELGYDINFEGTRGKRIHQQEKNMGDYAIFVTSEYNPWKKLTIKPGMRVAYNSVYKTPIVPSIFFKYKASKNNDVRFSYSRGYRAPSLKELYFYFVDINHNIKGNTNLQAETSNNYQLSLRTDYEKGKCRLVISNQLFFNDLSNLITLAQVTNTEYSYVNLAKAQTYGYTLNTNFLRKGFSIDAGLSIKGRKTQIYINETPRATSFYPEIKINPSYHIEKLNTSIAIFYKYTGKIPNFVVGNDGSVFESKREAFSMFDLTSTSHFYKNKLGFTIGVKNLFDIKSINGNFGSDGPHSSGATSIQIGMGRTYFCSLTVNLKTKDKK